MANNMSPIISVIVPCFKVEEYLNRCLESVTGQTLHDLEIILVDDCSPDRVPAMCEEWARKDARIKVVHNQCNIGLGLTRNEGLKVATGEYVAFVDSDDYIAPDMYEKLYTHAKENHADVVLCSFNFISYRGKITYRRDVEQKTVFDGRTAVDEFILDLVGPLPEEKRDVKYMMSVCHGIYKREILTQHAICFPSERQMVSEDLIFDLDFFSHAQCVVYLPDCMYYYCENTASLTHSFSAEKYEKYKTFLDAVEMRLAMLYPREKYRLHADRLRLLYLRVALFYTSNNKDVNMTIEHVANDTYWHPLMERYPFAQMEWKHRLFFTALKMHLLAIIRLMLLLI